MTNHAYGWLTPLAVVLSLVACADGTGPDSQSFQWIDAGHSHTCGLTKTGAAYCWGSNGSGELGSDVPSRSSTPVAVPGGLVFRTIHAGRGVTCGTLDRPTGTHVRGTAFCWGANDFGQLGDGTEIERSIPRAVAGAVVFDAVIPGGLHTTCGLATGGAAYCWGWNRSGQLGNGDTTNSSVPVAVAGGLTFASITTGYNHACALTGAGAVYCWPSNDRRTPWPVEEGRSFVALSAGYGTCGVDVNRALHCLGSGVVQGTGALRFTRISVGFDGHVCAIAEGGAAYCWGNNSGGQLGDGTTEPRSVPVPVSGSLSFTEISAGGNYTCGLTGAGIAYCWGSNGEGQLGDGTEARRTTPVAVLFPTR